MIRLLLSLLLLSWHTYGIAMLSIEIAPQNARLGETIRLTLSQHNPQSNAQPDLRPLEKDFIMTGTAVRMSYTSFNGVGQSVKQWVVMLVAKKQGTLPIPPIRVGQEETLPGQINISNTPQTTTDTDIDSTMPENKPIMLRTTIDKHSAFINEQVLYTVKLYSSQPLLNAEYQAPHMTDGILIPLGEGRRYRTTLNGRGYDVDEQQYALFPQKSGEIHITPPAINALVYDNIPHPIHLNGSLTQLTAKPRPTKASTSWLPAKEVTLTDAYDTSSMTMTEGQTLTRTITLTATGAPAELLPALDLTEHTGFSVYPEKPTLDNSLKQQDIVGSSTYTLTYILNQAGRITIPALHLKWYNTQTSTEEVATLPARTIEVAAKPVTKPKLNPTTSKTPIAVKPTPELIRAAPASGLWRTMAISIIILAFILICTGLIWARNKSQYTIRKQLRVACAMNNASMAHDALLKWATNQWPTQTILNLDDIQACITDPIFQQQIQRLSHQLYGPNTSKNTWQGADLWQSFKHYQPEKIQKRAYPRYTLPPINP